MKPLGTLLHVVEEGQRRALEPFARRAVRDGLDDALDDVLDLAVDDHRVEPLLAAEVLVHDGLRDAGALGDLLDRRRLVAALGEDRRPTSISCAPRRRR